MEKKEIENGSKLIAEFMGEKLSSSGIGIVRPAGWDDLFKYHCSWDWLMPVVEKIAKDYDVKITWMPTAIDVTYIDRPDVMDGEISSMGGMTGIENTFIAVVRFVEWYNTKSPNRKK